MQYIVKQWMNMRACLQSSKIRLGILIQKILKIRRVIYGNTLSRKGKTYKTVCYYVFSVKKESTTDMLYMESATLLQAYFLARL